MIPQKYWKNITVMLQNLLKMPSERGAGDKTEPYEGYIKKADGFLVLICQISGIMEQVMRSEFRK